VQIRDVHIRYEDDFSIPSQPFAMGFFVRSLSAQTCDDNWTPKFVYRDANQPMAFKIVELQNMGGYLNPNAEMLGHLLLSELSVNITRIFRENVYRDRFTKKNKLAPFQSRMSQLSSSIPNDYILNPVSATATIKRNCR